MSTKVYSVITDKILEILDKGVVPWHKPWQGSNGMPQNLVTKIPYKGVNIFTLAAISMVEGYSSPYWLSWKQVKKLGGRVKDDQARNYTPGIFSKRMSNMVEEKVRDKEGNESTEEVEKSYWISRYYNVYNTDQCEGLEKHIPDLNIEEHDFEPIKECEKIVKKMPDKPDVEHKGHRACYIPSKDKVELPKQSIFDSIEKYYSTLFHEMVHSTGHESRLARSGILENHFFGDKEYSREELVAEMGAAFLCGITGIDNETIDSSASYIDGWRKKLKEDNKIVVIAGSQAEKAADYITNKKRDY